MNKHVKKAVAIVPATLLLAMAIPTSAFAVTQHKQDFEDGTVGWSADDASTMTRVGAEGLIKASSGTDYLVLSKAGAYTQFGGYSDTWDGAWSTSTDVYLDPYWNGGTGFDYSVAANGSDGEHLRDFILHVAKDQSGHLLVDASNNTNFEVRTDLKSPDAAVIKQAGWYTMKHSFYAENGHLAVDVQLLDSDGKVVFTKHLASADDTMDKVGGNRYGWFTALSGTELAIDNVRLEPAKTTPTTPPAKPPVKPVAKPKAKVTAKATPKKNKMHVNVNPNQGKGYWNVKVQKLTKDGWKTLPGTYRTQGNAETRTINLPKGTYRTVVLPGHGHVAGVSNAVHLKK